MKLAKIQTYNQLFRFFNNFYDNNYEMEADVYQLRHIEVKFETDYFGIKLNKNVERVYYMRTLTMCSIFHSYTLSTEPVKTSNQLSDFLYERLGKKREDIRQCKSNMCATSH